MSDGQGNEIELTKETELEITLPITNEDKQDKSTFERAIIEAFKQSDPDKCIKRLTIALDEVRYYIEEVKLSQGANYLLNKNIIDKLSRITERKLFNVNILISKIYDHLLDSANFPILSTNQDLLIGFSNEILNLLDITKSTNVARSLDKKCSCFLNYLLNDSKSNFDNEQQVIIQELLESFPSRNSSDVFKYFQKVSDQVIALCKSSSFEDKLEGLLFLMDSFGDTNSLDEQYDLLLEYCPQIIKTIIYQPNPEYRQVYYQLGNFIISLLFTIKYKIEALPTNQEDKNETKKQKAKTFMFVDSSSQSNKMEFNSQSHLSFLNELLYELTTQKDSLLKCENIVTICNLIVNTLSIYDKMFELQYVCYLILKKIYFSFPQFRGSIEDSLASTLINLCMFKDKMEIYNSIECRQFLHYLLNYGGEESIKAKIQHRINSKDPSEINIKLEDGIPCHLTAVEYDQLYLNDFNLRIGYPNSYRIDAGAQYECYIEVEEANSLVYIAFSASSYDITFRLLKYINSSTNSDETSIEEGHFYEVFKLEKVACNDYSIKIIVFVCFPGIYKLVYDNTYSWITSKEIKHRLSVLSPLSTIIIPSSFIPQLDRNNKTSHSINDNKINRSMIIKHDGRTRNIDFGSIQIKQDLMIKNQSCILYLPVVVTSNSIRVINWKQNKLGNSLLVYTELLTNDNTQMDLESFESSIESYLSKVLIESSPIKTIYLNVFINDKTLTEINTIPMSNEESIKSSILKIGFYPGNLLSKYAHITYSCCRICNCCILTILQEKTMKESKITSLIHIHFDQKGAFSALYSEGVIQDKVNGFFYDNSNELTENMENVIEFINKAIVYFGVFELSISQTNIDAIVFESCCQVLQEKISKLETKINLRIYDQLFIENVFKFSSLFFNGY